MDTTNFEVEFEDAPLFTLRPYQTECINAVREGWKEYNRLLIVMATGGGKTVCFSMIAQEEVARGGRVLILAHTDELLEQAIDKLRKSTGIHADKEKADQHASPYAQVVVASIQSLSRINRLTGFADNHFSLVIVDETHRILSPSYIRVTRYFHWGSESLAEGWVMPEPGTPYQHKARVLGVTATADRGDKRSLGEFYQHCCFEWGLLEACRDGWLVRPIVKNIPLKIDLKRRSKEEKITRGGDYAADFLVARMEPVLKAIAEEIAKHAGDRKTVCFLPSIETASLMADALTACGLNASFVSGACDNRNEKIVDFDSAPNGSVICCAMLLCLDSETEILTDRGWVGHAEMTQAHKVANWNIDGTVFFEEPKDIVIREKERGEKMVYTPTTSNSSIRVTEGHQMLHWTGANWVKRAAREFIGVALRVPVSGRAEPSDVMIEQDNQPFDKHRIPKTAYNLRKHGMSFDESKVEAEKRIRERAALRRLNPRELSLDQCRLIGFWVGDGSRNNLIRSGVEYLLCQAETYPAIIKWVDGVLSRCGYNVVKRRKKPARLGNSHYFTWSLCRGTGSGCQKRKGIFDIEPYLDKMGSRLLWGLSEPQFDALIEGYWYADGHHGKAETLTNSFFFSDTKKPWLDLLQAIGCVRGYKTNLYQVFRGNDKHKPQWGLRMTKGKMKTFVAPHALKIEAGRPAEIVWCVRTTSKNIITRRRGSVTIMGNTEGWDCPSASCICVLRPTKIRSLFVQCAGRATRTLTGLIDGLETREERLSAIANSAKPDMLILDFLWVTDRLDLVSPIDLVAVKPEIRERMVGLRPPLVEAEAVAERDMLKALEKAAKKHARREARTIDPIAWAVSLGDVALATWEPETKWDSDPITPGQADFLRKNGIDPTNVKFKGLASKIVNRVITRLKLGLASVQQLSFMAQLGLDEQKCATLTRAEATATIDAVLKAKRGVSSPT